MEIDSRRKRSLVRGVSGAPLARSLATTAATVPAPTVSADPGEASASRVHRAESPFTARCNRPRRARREVACISAHRTLEQKTLDFGFAIEVNRSQETESSATVPALLITGFHRSGTSMAAEVLHAAGVQMGRRMNGAHWSNPHGHFEDIDVVDFHDRVLARAGSSWQFHDEVPLHLTSTDRTAMGRLIQSRNERHTSWGFKDPRASLFLNDWFAAIPSAKAVVLYRHYAECVASLFRRHAKQLLGCTPQTAPEHLALFQNVEIAPRAWLAYNRRLLESVEEAPSRCVVVSQHAILQGSNLISVVNDAFGLDLLPGPVTVDAEFVHHRAEPLPGWLPPGLRLELEDTWQRLQSAATASATDESRETQELPSASAPGNWSNPVGTGEALPSAEELERLSADECSNDARRCLRTGHLDRALLMATEAVERAPTAARHGVILGHVLTRLGRSSEAETEYLRAVALNPGKADLYLHAARAALRLRRPTGAVALLDTAWKDLSASADAQVLRARCCAALGMKDEAVQALEAALRVAPGLEAAVKLHAHLTLDPQFVPASKAPPTASPEALSRAIGYAHSIAEERGREVLMQLLRAEARLSDRQATSC